MASLLSLPEELLDVIIELVLLSERKPPPDIETARLGRGEVSKPFYGDPWEYGSRNTKFETSSTAPAAAALLLANKYFHQQTQQALARLFPSGINYKLDAMFVNEDQLWPTWLFVPSLSRKIDNIDVTIRIFGRRVEGIKSVFMSGNACPPPFVWLFYSLMKQFLYHGTASPNASAKLRPLRNITVKTINLNIISGEPDVEPEEDIEQLGKWLDRHYLYCAPRADPPLRLAEGEQIYMHPKWLADRLYSRLLGLASMDYYNAAYGNLLHERIGCINMFYKGNPLPKVMPGEILAGLDVRPNTDSEFCTSSTFGHLNRDCRLIMFWNWKYATVEQRKAEGLPVGKPMKWPTFEELRSWRSARDRYWESRTEDPVAIRCDPGRCACNDRGLEKMLQAREAIGKEQEVEI